MCGDIIIIIIIIIVDLDLELFVCAVQLFATNIYHRVGFCFIFVCFFLLCFFGSGV